MCISTQVGCPMGFARSARPDFGHKRNLRHARSPEVFAAARDVAPERITNVGRHGMGEPFLNYRRPCSAQGLNDGTGSPRGPLHRPSTSGLKTRYGASPTSRSSSTWR